jgi:hypothetical protein
MTSKAKMNPNKIARFAGFLYLLVAVCGIFNVVFGPESLVVPGDAAATVSNVKASGSLFRLSILSDIIGQTAHIEVLSEVVDCQYERSGVSLG